MDIVWQLQGLLHLPEDAERRLIRAAQRGDRRAFDALVRAQEPLLRGFLARRLPAAAVEDVMQETWLACWGALPRYSGQARFKAWLLGIAVHKCQDHYRSRSRLEAETSWEEAGREAADPKDWHAATERKQAVQAALKQLPAEQREVLELYYYADLTLAEIARMLERNLNTVKYQFYRAHAQAARHLLDDSEDPAGVKPTPVKGGARQ
ncbi:MAG TPA: sigma-70 family RNA polymerase sigma factor [Chthonomonadaceae bacterium]|nr:sigma-70 family RNA polymerase sigma factor [Chthonomonadaceae bacterium]